MNFQSLTKYCSECVTYNRHRIVETIKSSQIYTSSPRIYQVIKNRSICLGSLILDSYKNNANYFGLVLLNKSNKIFNLGKKIVSLYEKNTLLKVAFTINATLIGTLVMPIIIQELKTNIDNGKTKDSTSISNVTEKDSTYGDILEDSIPGITQPKIRTLVSLISMMFGIYLGSRPYMKNLPSCIESLPPFNPASKFLKILENFYSKTCPKVLNWSSPSVNLHSSLNYTALVKNACIAAKNKLINYGFNIANITKKHPNITAGFAGFASYQILNKLSSISNKIKSNHPQDDKKRRKSIS